MASLSETELAKLAGSTPRQVRRLVDLGILPRRNGADFERPDIQRVRLLEALDRAGIPLEAIGEAVAAGHLSFGFVDMLFPEPPALTGKVFRDVAAELRLPPEALIRLYAMWGLPRPREEDTVREDDAQLFADLGASVPPNALNEPTLTRGARILGESFRKVADAATTFFRAYFEEPALKSGMTRQEVIDMVGQVNAYMTPSLERWMLWLLHRHAEHNQIQYIVEHVEMAIEEAGVGRSRSGKSPAIAFLDLTGYTRLTEEQGDEAAADYALSLAELVQEVAAARGGRTVKLLGDGVMFHFDEPRGAVLSAFELVDRTAGAGLPPARVGVNSGPVVHRDGDYFGRTVNIAARIADYARPREVLVTPEVVAASDSAGLSFKEIGPVSLKGVPAPVTLYLASHP